MNPVQTGIAVALALVVVTVFFIFPGLSPFGSAPEVPSDQTAGVGDATNPTQPTMPTPDATSLEITDITVGTGVAAAAGDTVTVHYVGMLTNGTVFDASAGRGQPFSFTLGAGQVIQGWDQGLVGMKEGGKRKLVIPSALAYGNQAVGGVIPANATLIFEVELLKVEKGS